MSATSTGSKKTAAKLLAKDPDHYRKLARKSRASWEANGRKPTGFAVMSKDKLKKVAAKGGRSKGNKK